MTEIENNVELEVLDDAQLDEVTGGLLDFSGIRTINLSTGTLGQVVVGNNSNGINVAFTGVQVNAF
jgi:hypothetical protein